MNVGDLRKALVGLPDEMEVDLEIGREDPGAGEILVQADLSGICVEERCNEVERLYLSGTVPDPADVAADNSPKRARGGR